MDKDFLVGRFFFEMKDHKTIATQGYIIGCNKDETYFECEMFSWLLGDRLYNEIKDINFFLNCHLFISSEDRDNWHEYYKKCNPE